ncbi:MAG: PAS domain-containing protein [Marivibrio sp.]|uniref:PAS domain-containing protein n=1 Tax=Marivibrio sp. TaxID=2039719 RepID=UPI0032EFD4C8
MAGRFHIGAGASPHPFGAPDRGGPPLEWPSAQAAAEPELQAFADHWRTHCGPDGAPAPRSALDPLTLPRAMLGRLILSEREGPRRYRYRLFGTEMRDVLGRELTGKPLDAETMDGALEPFLDMLETVVSERRPVFLSGSIWWEGRAYRTFHQVTAPFRASDAPPDALPRFVCTLVCFPA